MSEGADEGEGGKFERENEREINGETGGEGEEIGEDWGGKPELIWNSKIIRNINQMNELIEMRELILMEREKTSERF